MEKLSETLLILAWAVAYAIAGAWPHFSSAPFPLAGLRRVAETGGLNVTLEVLTVLFAAGWLAFRSWQTRERLLIFQGMAIALCLQGCLYIGATFGLAFSCFAAIARNRCAKAACDH